MSLTSQKFNLSLTLMYYIFPINICMQKQQEQQQQQTANEMRKRYYGNRKKKLQKKINKKSYLKKNFEMYSSFLGWFKNFSEGRQD